jgi:hypothetical protein
MDNAPLLLRSSIALKLKDKFNPDHIFYYREYEIVFIWNGKKCHCEPKGRGNLGLRLLRRPAKRGTPRKDYQG